MNRLVSKSIFIHLIFFSLLLIIMIYIFYPVIHITFGEWEWMELEYHVRDIPPNTSKLLYWLKFYLTDQYGTTYALIGLAGLIFNGWMTGHYVMNVFLRMIAAISIYLLANWWTGKKIVGLIAGIFFAIAMPGIENTVWVIQFVAYIAVILLIVTLYFWKRFHDHPSIRNLKLSALSFGLTLFIAHVRLHALPFIIFLGESYFFFKRNKDDIHAKLKLRHFQILLLIFLTLLFTSSGLHITSQVLKTVSLTLIIKSLINGYPPIIHSFFLFIGNLILPPNVINLINPYVNKFLDFADLGEVSLIISAFGLISLFVNLVKRKYLFIFLSLLAVIYPLSLFYSRDYLAWEPSQLASVAVGGGIFFLIILMVIHLRKVSPRMGELASLGLVIILSHLFLPWIAFPQAEPNVQAAYGPDHRYYTVPAVGLSLIWATTFPYFWNNILELISSSLNRDRIILSGAIKAFTSISIILLLLILFIAHGLTVRSFLIGRVGHFPKERDTKLWNMIKPMFANLDRKKDRVVYFEGDLSEKDKSIVIYLLRHHLINELGFGRPGNKYNTTFIINRQQVKRLFEKDSSLYAQYNLPPSFSEADFMAFRVSGDNLEDIKQEILKEVKSTN